MSQDYYVTPARPTARLSRKTLILGGGLVIAVLLGAFLLLGSAGGNSMSKQLQHLSLRMNALQSLVEGEYVKTNLKDKELSQITVELKLGLASSTNELNPLMLIAGLPEKFDADVVAIETDTSTDMKLNEAVVNNNFSQVYGEILTQKIASLKALVAETYGLTKNVALQEALVRLDKSLDSAKKSLDKVT